MKVFLAIFVIALAIASSGCGGDDAATGAGGGEPGPAGFPTLSSPDDPRFATVTGGKGRRAELEIHPADRPPPPQPIARDLEVGSGPPARLGDRVAVWYRGVNHETGGIQFQIWPPRPRPLVAQLGRYGNAWEKGILGMRAGGRRQLLIPSSLTVNTGALDYVFDMVRVEPATGSGETDSEPATGSGEGAAGIPVVSDPDDPRFATVTGGKGRRAELEIDPADRPPPRRPIARDLELGSGPPVRLGDRVAAYFKGVDYETGRTRFDTWPPSFDPLVFPIRNSESSDVWEEAILGMRAGGRRELLVPSHLAIESEALDYVFDVVRIEPAAEAPAG